jgi:hypothetical protein
MRQRHSRPYVCRRSKQNKACTSTTITITHACMLPSSENLSRSRHARAYVRESWRSSCCLLHAACCVLRGEQWKVIGTFGWHEHECVRWCALVASRKDDAGLIHAYVQVQRLLFRKESQDASTKLFLLFCLPECLSTEHYAATTPSDLVIFSGEKHCTSYAWRCENGSKCIALETLSYDGHDLQNFQKNSLCT